MKLQNIISLIKEHENIKTVNKEIEKTRKHLKKLQIKQIIDTKRQALAEMEKAKARLDELKKLLLEKQEKRGKLEAEDTNSRIKHLNKLATENNQIKVLLEQCQATINKKGNIFYAHKNI